MKIKISIANVDPDRPSIDKVIFIEEERDGGHEISFIGDPDDKGDQYLITMLVEDIISLYERYGKETE